MAKATAADEKTRNAMIESFDHLRTGLDDVSEAQTEPARGAYAVADYDAVRVRPSTSGRRTSLTDAADETTTAWGISEIRLVWARVTGSSTEAWSAGSAVLPLIPQIRAATPRQPRSSRS